jgi:hypothetical protein
MSPLSAGYGVILPAGNAPRRWQADAILGKSLRTASPVAQLDSSSGFLIRRSQVRILPGTPIKSNTYVFTP